MTEASQTPASRDSAAELRAYDPWEHLSRFPEATLRYADLDDGVQGTFESRTWTITLARGMTPAETRCTLAHELGHLERGPIFSDASASAASQARLVSIEEQVVETIAAARLIDPADLLDLPIRVLRDGAQEVTDALGIDDNTLAAGLRLAGLLRS